MDFKAEDLPDIDFDNDLLIAFLEQLNLDSIVHHDISDTLQSLENNSVPNQQIEFPSENNIYNDVNRLNGGCSQSVPNSPTCASGVNKNYKTKHADLVKEDCDYKFDKSKWRNQWVDSDDSDDDLSALFPVAERNRRKVRKNQKLFYQSHDLNTSLKLHTSPHDLTIDNPPHIEASDFLCNTITDISQALSSTSNCGDVCSEHESPCIAPLSVSSEESGYDTSPTPSLFSSLPMDPLAEDELLSEIVEIMNALVCDEQPHNVPVLEKAKNSEEYIKQLKKYFQEENVSFDEPEIHSSSDSDAGVILDFPLSNKSIYQQGPCGKSNTIPKSESSKEILHKGGAACSVNDDADMVAENTPPSGFSFLPSNGCIPRKRNKGMKFEARNGGKEGFYNYTSINLEKFSTERKKILRMINCLEYAHGERDNKRIKMHATEDIEEEKIPKKLIRKKVRHQI